MSDARETPWTPGSWTAGEFEECGGYDCMYAGINIGNALLDGRYYGQKPCQEINADAKQRMVADAHLIAAAPELYDALKKLAMAAKRLENNLAEFGSVTDEVFFNDVFDAVTRARSALAKARGET